MNLAQRRNGGRERQAVRGQPRTVNVRVATKTDLDRFATKEDFERFLAPSTYSTWDLTPPWRPDAAPPVPMLTFMAVPDELPPVYLRCLAATPHLEP